jgi:hypothetical protein
MTGDRRSDRPPSPPDGAAGSVTLLDQFFDHDSLYLLRTTVEAHAIQAGLPGTGCGSPAPSATGIP